MTPEILNTHILEVTFEDGRTSIFPAQEYEDTPVRDLFETLRKKHGKAVLETKSQVAWIGRIKDYEESTCWVASGTMQHLILEMERTFGVTRCEECENWSEDREVNCPSCGKAFNRRLAS